MSAFTFPQPEESHNSASVPVPEKLLANLLVAAARGYATHHCPGGGCPYCEAFVAQWWRAHDLLSWEQKDRVIGVLVVEGIDYPLVEIS